MKINTAGYYGVSGESYNFGGNAAYNGRWRHGLGDVLRRSPAFNPLAYNPAIQYRPWNNNGARMPKASYGGSTNRVRRRDRVGHAQPAAGMGGGTVRSKLAVPKAGWIPDGSHAALLTSTPAGSIRYERLTIGNTPEPAEGADLFTGTITFKNPDCALAGTADTYNWVCPAGTGSAFSSPGDPACSSAGQVGTFSGTRTCCTDIGTVPDTRVRTTDAWFNASYPSGTPPAMLGTAGETCTSITYQGNRNVNKVPLTCTTMSQPCAGGGGELCTTTTCEQVPE